MDEIQALREEVAKLRERVAMLETEAARARPLGAIDWSSPVQIGTPTHRLVPMLPLPPGTIICGDVHG